MLEMTDNIIEVQSNTKLNDVVYKEIKDPYGFIYITTNLVNGKRYLGQKEFGQKNWKTYLGSGIAFKNALRTYGEANFSRNIIHICYSEEELNQIEYELSVFFDVVESDDWYNLVLGGGVSRGWHPSEETKIKMSERAKIRFADQTNHPRYGKPGLGGERNSQYGISPKDRMDKETYNQWYERHKTYWKNPTTKGVHIWEDKIHPKLGTHLTREQKDNLSEKAKERFVNPENHPMYGRPQSNLCKERVGDAHRGHNNWNTKPIYAIELDKIFWGAKEAYDEFGFDPSGIIKCCKCKRKSCGKHPVTKENLHWLYANNAVEQGYIAQQKLDDYLNNLNSKEIDNYGKR
jgi:group I intron endonuclease